MQRTFEGKIVSIKMNRTVAVEVTRQSAHPLYKKLIKRSKKHLADSADLKLEVGQNVRIAEIRPMSKNKFFKVVEVIKWFNIEQC